ncbi:Chemotaxis protein CheA [Chlamydiales bacterium SCGC AG-110-P3]|nr:Chemotaxis protein CheA [Chlamydiales bacterium SCGC AG-110-P3]
MDDNEIYNEFTQEAADSLDGIEEDLLLIEGQGASIDSALVNKVFRAIHSIKGAAACLELKNIETVSHSMEDILNQIRNTRLIPSAEVISPLLNAVDLLNTLLQDLASSNSVNIEACIQQLRSVEAMYQSELSAEFSDQNVAPNTTNYKALSLESTQDLSASVSVDVTGEQEDPRDSCVLNGARHEDESRTATGTAVGQELDLSNLLSAPGETCEVVGEQEAVEVGAHASQEGEGSLRVPLKTLNKLMGLAEELVLSRNQLLENMRTGDVSDIQRVSRELDLIVSDLQHSIMSTRMQPVGKVFNRFYRSVRDLSSLLDKKIEVEIEGEDVELDKTIIELIGDPLHHLVRNAVDHGIETPEDRLLAGKEEFGNLKIKAFQKEGHVVIEVTDDGRGIDTERIRESARNTYGIEEERLQQMSDKEVNELIFLPGLSLARIVTPFSGRGVGMDVVFTNLTKLGGIIDVESVPGKGCTIRIRLPCSLAIIPSLIIRIDNEQYVLPQPNLVELLSLSTADVGRTIQEVAGTPFLQFRDELLPVIDLKQTLGGGTMGSGSLQREELPSSHCCRLQ